jgi:NitT/TauT family transport system substrate-binding protein
MKRSQARPLVGAIALLSLTALAACTTAAPEAPDGPDELIPVTVGIIPIGDVAPLFLGDSLGFFEEAGLELTIETATGGAAIVPAVVAGEYQFGFSNLISLMIATDKELPVQLVSPGPSSSGDTTSDFGAIIVKDDSPIERPADLAGKTVSSNTLNNIVDTVVRGVVDDDGGDSSTINFVEVPFPDAVAAVTNDQVDAAFVVEPFVSSALAAGLRVLSYGYADFDPNLDVAGYFTSTTYLASDADVVEKFTEAMARSQEYAQANPDEVRAIVATYTTIPPEVLAGIVLPGFKPEFNEGAVGKLADAALTYGLVSKEVDLSTFLP